MFSRLRGSICLLVLLFAASGCARLGFGEKILPAPPLKIGGGETACLRDAGKTLAGYIDGEEGPEAIESMFGCVDSSIQLFLDRTRTSTPGIYQPVELRNFIEKFFIGENVLSNALMAETMEFKRTILGGRGDVLTASELRSAQRIMGALKQKLLVLAPYRPLTFSKLASLGPVEQNRVLAVLGQAAEEFGIEMSANAGDYSMNRLEALVREYEAIFPSDPLKMVLRRFRLIRSFKPVLFGSSPDEFRGEEWPKVLRTAVRALGIYIKVQPIYPDESGRFPVLSCGSGLLRFREAGLEFLQMLDDAVLHHGSLQMIPLVELSRLIDDLEENDLGDVRRLSLKRLLKAGVQRYLAGETEGFFGRDAEGITRVAIERLRRAFLDWFDGQQFIEGVFSRLGSFDCQGDPLERPLYSLEAIQSISPEEALGRARAEELEVRTRVAVETFRQALQRLEPLYGPTGVQFLLDPSQSERGFSYNDLLQANWLTVGYVLAQQGYRERQYDAIREREGDPDAMAIMELDRLYRDIRDIGRDLKFIDPLQYDAAKMRARDGNLFMPASDGNMTLLSMPEALQLMGTMISGKSVSSKIRDQLEQVCKTMPGGMFETRIIEETCFRDKLQLRRHEFFANLPGLLDYLDLGGVASTTRFFDLLFEVVRLEAMFPGYIEVNDSDRMITLLHYIELVYGTFDLDRTGTLDTAESLAAFDRFELILKQLAAKSGINDRETLQALFTYMLTRGKAPESAAEKAGFAWWKFRGPKNWKLKVDRPMILRVFAQIAEATKGAKVDPSMRATLSRSEPEVTPTAVEPMDR